MAQVNNLLIKGTARSIGKIKAPQFDGKLVGNSDTATKLATARTISLTGDVTGSGSFDGSANLSITATVVDDSHNHVISNIDNLQSSLDAKAPLASPALTGTPTAPTAGASTNNTQIATTAFVQSLINSKIASADAMIYKGTIGTSGTITALPDTHSIGWTYKVITAGTYAGVNCEVGDMIICLTDGTTANNSDWTVVQTNIDGAVTGPASSVDAHIATFNGATGKVIKDSGFTIATSVPANAKFTDTTYSAGTGISLSGTTFSNSGVRSVTVGSSSNQITVNTGGTSSTITVNNVANATKATQDGDGNTISSTYAKLSGATFTGEVVIKSTHRDTYYASNLCRHFSKNTPTEFVIKTKIKYVSSTHMPIVRIYGYAYGLSSPIELRIGFYIYSDAFYAPGVSCTGAWKPEVYLFKYTEDSVDYVAIGFKGSCYFAGFQVDAQVGGSGSFDTNFLTSGWTTENNGADTSVTLIPSVGTDNCVLAPYKTMKTDISGSAKSATQDSEGQQINTTYIKGLSVSGKTITYTKGDGTTGTITTQDTTYSAATSSALGLVKIGSNITVSSGTISLTKANVTDALGYTPPSINTEYAVFTGATSSSAGTSGLVPAPASGKQTSFLRGDGTWVVPTDTNTKVTQTVSTANEVLPILAKNSTATSTVTDTSKFAANITMNPSTGTISATTFSGALSGNATTATTLATSRTINGTSFNGSANITTANWGTARNISITDGTNTSTAVSVNGSANVSLKLPTKIEGDLLGELILGTQTTGTYNWTGTSKYVTSLYDGLHIRYWLPYNVSTADGSASPAKLTLTLADGTVTDPINLYYKGTSTLTGHYVGGTVISLTYRSGVSINGSSTTYTGFWADADYDSNTDTKVTQTITTTNAEYALLAMADAAATDTKTNTSRFSSGVTLNPSTNTITATTFSGALSGNATTATTLKTARTIALTGDVTGSASFNGSANASIASTLASSGVTAGSYGPTAAATLAFGGSVNVPYVTFDAKGRATSAAHYAIKLPAAPTTVSGNAGTATKLATARTIDGVSFNGSANITHFGTCSTAAATVEKAVACTGFTLATGAVVTVNFTVTNTASSPTLNVNSTGAKNIFYRGAAISAGYLAANRTYTFVYDGTQYNLIGDINTDTNTKVTQTVTTTNATYPILACVTADATATTTTTARFGTGIKLNPSTSSIICSSTNYTIPAIQTVYTLVSATSPTGSNNIITISEPNDSGSNYGKNICITGCGASIFGSGESPNSLLTELVSNNSEDTYICADGNIFFYSGANTYANKKTGSIDTSGNLSIAGTITGTAVYNAVWNDYAEFFPRGEETEAGDFIALSLDSDDEVYVKASKETSRAVGIHSDTFGHLIGGETPPDEKDFVTYNLPKYIPVGLVGRVQAKVLGCIKKGDFLVISDISGVGRKFQKGIDDALDIIGMACESSEEEGIKRIKVKLGN